MIRKNRNEGVVNSEAPRVVVSEKQGDDCCVCNLVDKGWGKWSNSRSGKFG